jgi:HD-GYP domain-containing protein (c-di-GMP phosphodiesterase class II)
VEIRAAEIVGALSLATDLGTGQPLEHALRTAVLAVTLGELAGASQAELVAAYYASLLHSSGCTSDAHETALLFGDDIAPRAAFALVDPALPEELLAFLKGNVASPAVVEQLLAAGPAPLRETFATHCEVAQRFAAWLGLDPGTRSALACVFERWDGHGFPGASGGDAIPQPARLLHVARDISVFLSARDAGTARAVVERRAGTAYDPRLAELAVRAFDELVGGLQPARLWEQALEREPLPQVRMSGDGVDAAFGAIAAFADLKSPWLRGHSTGVAALAEAAAWRARLAPEAVEQVRWAALAHDLGRVGVSNAIWEKDGPLGLGEWERVRLHPHFTERAFALSPTLAPLGVLAGSHHERLDGSGYHRGTRAAGLGREACLLAAADCYQAMREPRPYRPALDATAAEAALLEQAVGGRLDREAVDAVLAAAGHRVARQPRVLPAGLSERELEVLLELVAGRSNQEIGETLGISPRTVGHHVQHVYRKAGVRTRAAATVWAFEHSLVRRDL